MKYSALGAVIRTARKAAGLEQQDVARQLGVGQQAVSAWERGASRPRERQLAEVCALINLDIQDAREAGGYDAPAVKPTRARLLVLPFEHLTDEAFEAFCRDLLRGLHPMRQATRNGASGTKQFGVDVFLEGDGERVGVQCKRHRTFGPREVRDAIDAVLPEAGITSGIITLSRPTATPTTRLAVMDTPGWQIWDGEDLSARVRDLPKDRQLALIDAYFPGLREDFLGIQEPSPWLTPTTYEASLAGRLGLDGDFALAGRQSELDELSRLVDSHTQFMLLTGRGGIGKSRLLRELASRDLGREVRFASRGPVARESFEALPQGAPVVVMDDAADPELNLAYLVEGILTARPDASILLATRPTSVDRLKEVLSFPDDSLDAATVEVGDLVMSEAGSLARTALGTDSSDAAAEALAHVGYDCPLLIVVGADLIRREALKPHELASQAALRQAILTRYADVVLHGSKRDARTSVLESIAAIQPAHLDQADLLSGALEVSGQAEDTFFELLDELEDLGVILRRNQTVRVVPDLLGEAILERAMLSRSGRPTQFGRRIATSARGRALAHAIQNVSLLDWHRGQTAQSDLAENLWAALIEYALTLPNSDRIAMARSVQLVAGIHSSRALDFAERLLDNPAPDEPDPVSIILRLNAPITGAKCSQSLARLVSNAGHDLESLRRSMKLLLRIGREDHQPEHQHPDHAIRLLRELGEYSPERPLRFAEEYLGEVEDLLRSDRNAADRPLLLSLLKPALAHELHITTSRRMQISMSRRSVNLDVTASLRATAIRIAGEYLAGDVSSGIAAIDVLQEALSSADRNDPVTDEFAVVSGLLHELFSKSERPAALRLAAYQALGWHALYGEGERRDLARKLRRDLYVDADLRVIRVMRTGWGLEEDPESEEEEPTAGTRYEHMLDSKRRDADAVLEAWERLEDAEVLSRIGRLLRDEFATAKRFAPPDDLLVRLLAGRTAAAIDTLAARPGSEDPAEAILQRAAVASLLTAAAPDAESVLVRYLSSNANAAKQVALAVTGIRAPLDVARSAVVRALMALGDPQILYILLSAARWFDPADHGMVMDLLVAAPIEQDAGVATEAATILTDERLIGWPTLGAATRAAFLARFAETPQLPPYEFALLLNAEIRLNAQAALEFLMRRIDQSSDREDFEPIPHMWHEPLAFRESADFPFILSRLVGWLAQADSWQRDFHGRHLFEQIVGPYSEEVLMIFKRLIGDGGENEIRLVRDLISDAPRTFVVDHTEFVVEAIQIAEGRGTDITASVVAGLHGSAEYGMRSRTVGDDDPEEVSLQDRANTIAIAHPEGSTVRSFYEAVAARAAPNRC